MKPFSLGLGGLILRFYAMMAVVIIGGFTGQYWLMVLALPIFLSAMMGVKMGGNNEKEAVKKELAQEKTKTRAA